MTKLGNVLKGVAIGDSWGDINEFRSINAIIKDNPMGPELPDTLHVTDDTQMTLFLATALETARGQDMNLTKEIIIQSYLNYYNDTLANDGTRAPDSTVMGSLGKLNRGLPWQEATNPHSDGSGTVMWTSACAFLPEDQWVGITAFAAALTHGSANAIAAAILDVALVRELLAGEIRLGQLLSRAAELANDFHRYGLNEVGEWLDGYEIPNGLESGFKELARLLSEAQASARVLQADPWAKDSDPSLHVGGGGGRGHETLVIALLAIEMFPEDPWLALRRSVTTDGDSDTIGAVTGALLGAGEAEWPDVLARLEPEYRDWITEAQNYFSEAVA